MARLIEICKDYLFGTRMLQYYNTEINFYREFSDETIDTTNIIKLTEKERKHSLFFGKTFPNLIDLGAIIYSIATGEPPYFLAIGELIRIYHIRTMKKRMRESELQRKFLQERWYRIQEVEENIKKLESLKDTIDRLNDDLDDREL